MIGIQAVPLTTLEASGSETGTPPQASEPIHVSPVSTRITVDGVLDEEAWQKATKIDLLYEWSPGENVPPPVQTQCFITYNRSYLFIAFRCSDPDPQKIRAHLMNRDAIGAFSQDDYVRVSIDSFNDARRAFQFCVNPYGVQVDGIYNSLAGFEDLSWDAIWNSAGKITDAGYTVEMAIPFHQLRFSAKPGEQTWGIDIERFYPRSVLHSIGSHPLDRDSQYPIYRYHKITGFQGISAGKNIELDPTVTFHRTDQRPDDPPFDMQAGKIKVKPGLSAKWGISPNLILNAAVNPDFSQVEADAAQLEINTRFALMYSEKRPFFLEGLDYFSTPIDALYTRTVYEPSWGLKTTGKIGGNALGVFIASDRYNNLLFPSNQGSDSTAYEDRVLNGVVRYRRDIGKSSTIGVLVTGRDGRDYYNHVAGIDGFIGISKTKKLTVQFLGSATQYPGNISAEFAQETGRLNGSALYTQFRHRGRAFHYYLTYEAFSPRFRADSGFVPRVDTRRAEFGFIPYIWGKKEGWFHKMSFLFWGQRITDFQNTLTNQDFELAYQYEGPLQTLLRQAFTLRKELFLGTVYDFHTMDTLFEIKPAGGVGFFLFARYGGAIDYNNSRAAHSVYINPAVDLSPGKHVNISLNHTYERLSAEGERIYTANLFQAQIIYNFNVRSFFRAVFQYTHIDRNLDLYVSSAEPLTKKLFTQFLFSYKLNPQTVLFLGYSDNYSNFVKSIDITRKNRTFFLKIGYALGL